MKKLLYLLLLISGSAFAQITPAQDTTLIIPNTPVTLQQRVSQQTISGVNYRILQMYNSILGKYDTYPTTKYLRAFYAPIVSGGYVPLSDTTGAQGYVKRWYLTNQLALKANLSGGNAFTGNQTISSGGTDGLYFGYTGFNTGRIWANAIASKSNSNWGLSLADSYSVLNAGTNSGLVEISIADDPKIQVTKDTTYLYNKLRLQSVSAGSTSDRIAMLDPSTGLVKYIAGNTYQTATAVKNSLSKLAIINQYDKSSPEIAPSAISGSTYDAFGMLMQTQSGKYIYAYRQGTSHASDAGVIKIIYSTNGVDYTAPVTLQSESGVDLRDVSGGVTPSGRIVIFWSRYDWTNPTPDIYFNSKYIYSDDDGATWSSPVTISNNRVYGSLVSIGEGKTAMAVIAIDTPYTVRFITSSDDWATFSSPVTIVTSGTDNYNETSLAYLGNDIILAITRVEGDIFHQFLSQDNGATWTANGAITFDSNAHASPFLSTYVSPSGRRMVSLFYANRAANLIRVITAYAVDIINDGVSAWDDNTLTNVASNANNDFGYPTVVHPNNTEYSVGAFYKGDGSGSVANTNFFTYPSGGVQPVLKGDAYISGTLNIEKNGSDNNLSIGSTGQYTTFSLKNNGSIKAQVYWDQTAGDLNITTVGGAALNLSNPTKTTTQSAGDNSTKVATTAYVDAHTPQVAASYSLSGKTNVGTLFTYNVPSDGVYRIGFNIFVTAISTNTFRYRLDYTQVSGQVQSLTGATQSTTTPTTAVANAGGTLSGNMLYLKGGTALTLSTENVVTGGSQTYDVTAFLEKMP